MVRSRFDAQLEQLNVELIKMGALCEEAITASVSALMKYDRTVVQMVFEKDNEIDHMERDIETFCMRLLLQQPQLRLLPAKALHNSRPGLGRHCHK